MEDLVNAFKAIESESRGSGLTFKLDNASIRISGPSGITRFKLKKLYRPSSQDVQEAVSQDSILVLENATKKAVREAARHNHVSLPFGSYRIIAPGLALFRDAAPIIEPTRQAKLKGRTGVIAETLLLGGDRQWSIRQLATEARIAPSFVHRVVTRLEREGILFAEGTGNEKTRIVRSQTALAETWSQEDKFPDNIIKGFLYGSSNEDIALKIIAVCPSCAIGAIMAANLYKPTLTRVVPPIRIWIPTDFDLNELKNAGFEQTLEGANLELTQTKGDPWSVHRTTESIPRVSKWRALHEIAGATGRTQELAESLFEELRRR